MEEVKKYTKEDLSEYLDIQKGTKISADDDIDSDRWDKICYLARSDVYDHRPKRTSSEFASEEEYKLYLLSVYSTALGIKKGIY